jgi:pyridoxal phosphate enzyme (YggS family)
MKPVADILQLYELGHRDFGENYVQELLIKQPALPVDIRWHFIGHLQSNKVKQIAPFIHLIHSVDSFKLFREIHKEGFKQKRVIDCLLQVHISKEETKFGFNNAEVGSVFQEIKSLEVNSGKLFARVAGLMGMASFSEDQQLLLEEFQSLKKIYDQLQGQRTESIEMQYLSMGMSNDYALAVTAGSNMVRVGSLLFGMR